MLVDYIALLPEAVLLTGIVLVVLVAVLRSVNTAKTFYTLSKWILLPVIALTAVFYDQNIAVLWENNDYTTLLKVIIYLFSLGWCSLSYKRFQNKEGESFVFHLLVLMSLFCFSVGLSSRALWLTAAAFTVYQLAVVLMQQIEATEETCRRRRLYLFFSGMFVVFLWTGIFLFYRQCDGTTYEEITGLLSVADLSSPKLRLAFVLIMLFFLFVLGAAPFHFGFTEAVSGSVLPVAGFLSIVPVLAFFPAMINLLLNVFAPLYGWFMPVMVIFGIISIFIGAVGANSADNLRRIFACAELYYVGVLLVAASDLQRQSLSAALIYMQIYVLAFFGLYTVFSGFRSKGEYLTRLSEIRGLSTRRPFLAAAFLVLMISLIGMPPLLGFLGKLSVVNILVAGGSYGLMAVVAFSVLILACAYLKVITVIYFEPRNINFDRVDKNVYIYIAINILLFVFTVLNPKYLMRETEMILTAIL